MAEAYMRRESVAATLQPTALLHDVYVRLVQSRHLAWESRAHFCAIAAHVMRQALVDAARRRRARRRGGALQRVTLAPDLVADVAAAVDLEGLDEALSALAALDPIRAQLVELRYFGGLTLEEVADVQQVSLATIKRRWALARAWLADRLTAGPAS